MRTRTRIAVALPAFAAVLAYASPSRTSSAGHVPYLHSERETDLGESCICGGSRYLVYKGMISLRPD